MLEVIMGRAGSGKTQACLAAMQKQMEAQLKADPQQAAQLAALQKSNPTEYAKMQVKQIKQLLGITE